MYLSIICIHIYNNIYMGDFHKWGYPKMDGLKRKIPNHQECTGPAPSSLRWPRRSPAASWRPLQTRKNSAANGDVFETKHMEWTV